MQFKNTLFIVLLVFIPSIVAMTPTQRRMQQQLQAKRAQEKQQPALNYALMQAALDGNTDSVNNFLQKGADVNCADDNKNTPLHLACLNQHYDTAKLLLERKANPNAANDTQSTPLHF